MNIDLPTFADTLDGSGSSTIISSLCNDARQWITEALDQVRAAQAVLTAAVNDLQVNLNAYLSTYNAGVDRLCRDSVFTAFVENYVAYKLEYSVDGRMLS
jgi:hypothetical protein